MPLALLQQVRRRSFIASATLVVGDSLPAGRKIRETAHHVGAIRLRAQVGHFHKIPRVSPIPGHTHLTHLLDAYARGEGKIEPPLANDVWEPSPDWQVCVPVDNHVNRAARAFITSVSLPINQPNSGNHALFTWTTSLLAHDSSLLLPTMMVSREAAGRDWHITFASGTLFDDGLWLRDSVAQPECVTVHGAWDLYWSTDHGCTFRTLSDEQWQVLDCVPFGERSIFAVEVAGSGLTVSLWEYLPNEPRGKIERWTVGGLSGARPYLQSREEDELTEILRRVASDMAPMRDANGLLRVAVRRRRPPMSLLRPSSWLQDPWAEPVLQVRAETDWEDVPLTELLMTALARAEASPGAEAESW